MTDRTDAALVEAARSGDRDAFGEIYERYADRVYGLCMTVLRRPADAADATQDTFIRAAERLEQLRSPARLRSWLFSIARNESLQRIRRSSRLDPLYDDEDGEGPGGTPLVVEGAEAAAMQAVADDELRDLVWDASEGLEDRDRAVLDLYVRQGLEGEELGEAMGVSTEYAYQLTRRVRTRIERALGALLVARLGRDECGELQRLLVGWDGTYDPTVRRRVVRHVDGCEVCQANRVALTSPVALFASVPLLPVPLAIKGEVMAAVTAGGLLGGSAATAAAGGTGGGSPGGSTGGGPAPVVVGAVVAAVALVLVLVGALAWNASRDDDSSPLAGTTAAGGDTAAGPGADGGAGPAPTASAATSATSAAPTTAAPEAAAPTTTAPTTVAPTTTAPTTVAPTTTAPPPPNPAPPTPPPPTAAPPTAPPPNTSPSTTVPPTTVPPPPPVRVEVSPGLVDVGTGTSATLTLSNQGGEPAAFAVSAIPPGVSLQPSSGTVAPGSAVQLTVVVDRAVAPVPVDTVVQLQVGGLTLPVAVTAS